MSTEPLERELADLTAPAQGEPVLWRAALAESSAQTGRAPWWRSNRIAAVLLLGVFITVALVFAFGGPGGGVRQSALRSPPPMDSEMQDQGRAAGDGMGDKQLTLGSVPPPSPVVDAAIEPDDRVRSESGDNPRMRGGDARQFAAVRHVARRVEIELVTGDVAATFARANHLLSPASGEYAEASSLAGEGPQARGELTLRISAERLDEFMNELRGLATVARETSSAEDVTDRIVDLDARLANARHVEQELLTLLDKRTTADLDDILSVRARLNDIRLEIERLSAAQPTRRAYHTLARVLIIIRHEDADHPAMPESASNTILGRAVERGWGSLVLSIGWVVEVLVSGLLFWAAIAAAACFAWRASRKPVIVR